MLREEHKKWNQHQKEIKQQDMKEELSAKEWREIMGQDRQILSRGKGGAYRRKGRL